MIGMLVESIIVSFILGGIIGAITAMHINQQQTDAMKKVPIRVKRDQDPSNRH